MSPEAFGPNLRWMRLRHGVSLEEMSARTKVSIELWEAMERSDFSAWPKGLYARAYLRDYANIIGIDADRIVDEFCRLFPERGDRRADRLLRGSAAIVGHDFSPESHHLPAGVREDRRAAAEASPRGKPKHSLTDLRILATFLDQGTVLLLAGAATLVEPHHFWMVLAIVALVYHGAGVASAGCSPATWALRTYLGRQPRATGEPDVFPRLPQTIDHA